MPRAKFAEADPDKALPPPGPGESSGRRAAMAAKARQQLTVDRELAAASVDAFVGSRRVKAAQLASLAPDLIAQVDGAGSSSIDAINAATTSQIEAVRDSVRAVRTQVQSRARQLRAGIEADHRATAAAIRATTTRTRAAINTASASALQQAATAETSQLGHLATLYTGAEEQFGSAAQTAASLALSTAGARAAMYRSRKINREDSFLDGYLTDNRCDAQAEAAEKVGGGYRDELVKEGDKQVAELRRRRPTDEGSVRHVSEEGRRSLSELKEVALRGLADTEAQSIQNASAAKSSLLSQVDDAARSVERGLREHERAQIAQLQRRAAQQTAAVADAVAAAQEGLREAIADAVAGVDTALFAFISQLNAAEVPQLAALNRSLADTNLRLDVQLDQLLQGLRVQAEQAAQATTNVGTETKAAITDAGGAAVRATNETGAGATSTFAMLGSQAKKSFGDLAEGHDKAAQRSQTGLTSGVQSVITGISNGFIQLNRNFTDGARQNADNVREGLSQVVRQDMPVVISEEARKARDQVQPRWKSVLKWVIIIAIVLVVAIVLGPMVIGAVTGAAAALGASAGAASVIGMVVGGALVGAATSAATTVVDNALAGRELSTGLGTAVVMGALGGALGGAASGLLAGPMQGMTALGRYGVQVASDVVLDTTLNLVTGNLSWENFATGLLMSAFVSGVTAHPRVQAIQHGFSSRGYGAGFDAGRGARSAFTGQGRPGSAGAIAIDATHVNVGDTAGPNSPYAGKWDMAGGGHNAAEIRARTATEGYTQGPGTMAKDPITGVAIDRFGRTVLDNARNPVLDAAGNAKVKTVDKSLFPESMGRPEIEAAGRTALEQAIAGSPQATHTPPGTHPNGAPKNGSFSAIVVTPDGHPIRVEGYYAPAPGGGWEIKTVYPATNLGSSTIPPVSGSRISVPGGVVTPPDYDYGD